MVLGMATSKVTITLDDDQLASLRSLVATGKADSVSGFVKYAVSVALADVAGWGALLGAALEETGGALTAKERAWADSVLRPAVKPRPRRRRKAA
jgi:Arc/MetJ-type ribon-helix-helix transcriptional regulator